jgi:hypothetical protein
MSDDNRDEDFIDWFCELATHYYVAARLAAKAQLVPMGSLALMVRRSVAVAAGRPARAPARRARAVAPERAAPVVGVVTGKP